MTASLAERAACPRAERRLREAHPRPAGEPRARENARLAEAIVRQGAPGAWCAVGRGELHARVAADLVDPLDGLALRDVLEWLLASRATRDAWRDEQARTNYPALGALAAELPPFDLLTAELERCLDADGRVRDAASPALARARADVARGERELERMLERWARGFGENAYVTRAADRFVAMIPAAGFSRKRGLVHGVSGSGQSLLVEPLEACEANNHLLESRATAFEEERRVLRALGDAVRSAADVLDTLEEVLSHLDALRASAQWARDVNAVAIEPGGDRLRLIAARHPLLALAARNAAVVPLDLTLGPTDRLLLVSGPNMGGKTILLKTVGLAVALAHAALPVPAAEGSTVPEIDGVWVDLGDEQSVDRGLSTFAAHLQALRAMAEHAGPTTLLLCDELGAGTDPDEGAALGRALIEHVAARGAWGVMSTHLGSLKRLAGEVPGVVNGSLDFDEHTFTSRFQFLPGVPGASHALAVAERLGFPSDVLERARVLTPESTRAVERLLADLQRARREAEEATERLAEARAAAEQAEQAHRAAERHARETLDVTRRRLTAESDALLARSRELWQTIQREARRADKSRTAAESVRSELHAVEARSEALTRDAAAALEAAGAAPAAATALDHVTLGQRVRVADLGVEAEVASLPDAEGRLLLRRGSWNIQSHIARLRPVESAEAPAAGMRRAAGGAVVTWDAPADAPGLDVDIRGREVDEALAELDRGLDRAVVGGLHELRVVHGIGRGVLRAAVERHLRSHPQVASQRLGAVGEGGRGVTIVGLR